MRQFILLSIILFALIGCTHKTSVEPIAQERILEDSKLHQSLPSRSEVDTCSVDSKGVVRFYEEDGEKKIYRNDCREGILTKYSCKGNSLVQEKIICASAKCLQKPYGDICDNITERREPIICLQIQEIKQLVDNMEDLKKQYYSYSSLDTRVKRINDWIKAHNKLANSVNYLYLDPSQTQLHEITCGNNTVKQEIALLHQIVEKDKIEIERQDYSLRQALPDDYTLDWEEQK